MKEVLEKIEKLIDDLERDGLMTKDEVLESLYKLKDEIETNGTR
jgi:polyhydroxyalkanoate synthesis regulator phasin